MPVVVYPVCVDCTYMCLCDQRNWEYVKGPSQNRCGRYLSQDLLPHDNCQRLKRPIGPDLNILGPPELQYNLRSCRQLIQLSLSVVTLHLDKAIAGLSTWIHIRHPVTEPNAADARISSKY